MRKRTLRPSSHGCLWDVPGSDGGDEQHRPQYPVGRGRGSAGAPPGPCPLRAENIAGKGKRSKTQRWERPEVLLELRCHQMAQGQWLQNEAVDVCKGQRNADFSPWAVGN